MEFDHADSGPHDIETQTKIVDTHGPKWIAPTPCSIHATQTMRSILKHFNQSIHQSESINQHRLNYSLVLTTSNLAYSSEPRIDGSALILSGVNTSFVTNFWRSWDFFQFLGKLKIDKNAPQTILDLLDCIKSRRLQIQDQKPLVATKFGTISRSDQLNVTKLVISCCLELTPVFENFFNFWRFWQGLYYYDLTFLRFFLGPSCVSLKGQVIPIFPTWTSHSLTN